MRIGIGVTTHNRPDVFRKTMQNILHHLPIGAKIVVVDDASTRPAIGIDPWDIQYYRFETNVGIAAAKNKCFELLEDCEHIFLFDDDTYPVEENWWVPYVESKEPHLMYIFKDFIKPRLNDTTTVYQDKSIVASSHPRGCMLYFRSECLRVVGGMDTVFGKWGYEHADLSNRIFNAGFTSFRYMDVPDSRKLFYSADEHEAVETTCGGLERRQQINVNKPIYDARKYSAQYVQYKEVKKRDIVITTFFTGVKDPQRPNGFNLAEGINGLSSLLTSCHALGQNTIILHDGALSHMKDQALTKWVEVETSINPYFQRWISIMQYLKDNRDNIGKVFCVDATDVEMLRNPFNEMDDYMLYCGDEEEKLYCEWMIRHHRHADIQRIIIMCRNDKLLNAGLLGGGVDDVIKFCRLVMDKYSDFSTDRMGAGMTDMGVFNLIMRTKYNSSGRTHGQIVNTKFKANERNNISWWKHK